MRKNLFLTIIAITLMSAIFKTFFEDVKSKLAVYRLGHLQEKVYLYCERTVLPKNTISYLWLKKVNP